MSLSRARWCRNTSCRCCPCVCWRAGTDHGAAYSVRQFFFLFLARRHLVPPAHLDNLQHEAVVDLFVHLGPLVVLGLDEQVPLQVVGQDRVLRGAPDEKRRERRVGVGTVAVGLKLERLHQLQQVQLQFLGIPSGKNGVHARVRT